MAATVGSYRGGGRPVPHGTASTQLPGRVAYPLDGARRELSTSVLATTAWPGSGRRHSLNSSNRSLSAPSSITTTVA